MTQRSGAGQAPDSKGILPLGRDRDSLIVAGCLIEISEGNLMFLVFLGGDRSCDTVLLIGGFEAPAQLGKGLLLD